MNDEEACSIQLYVSGLTVEIQESIVYLKSVLKEKTGSNYKFEVIDVLENLDKLDEHKVMATPTLLRVSPRPVKKILVDLCNQDKMDAGLSVILEELN